MIYFHKPTSKDVGCWSKNGKIDIWSYFENM